MTRATFDRLKELLPHVESLELNGLWGEAFLHPELYMYMLREIKASGTDVYTISNGTLLSDGLARDIIEAGLDRLVISLDAATPETYAEVRPPGKFDDVISGLKSLAKWQKELNRSNPRVELAFVGMRSNIEEFPDFVRLAAELGVFQVFLQAMGEYELVKGESVAQHYKELGRRIFEEGVQVGTENGVSVNLLPEDQFEEDRDAHNFTPNYSELQKNCRDLWNKAIITTQGDVLTCCCGTRALGNINEQSFADIWHGKAYRDLRAEFLGPQPPEMCRQCTGMSWIKKSAKKDFQFVVDLAGIKIKQQYKGTVLYNTVKPLLKVVKRVVLPCL